MMKLRLIIIIQLAIFGLSENAFCQTKYSPFEGAFHLGSGISSSIDFDMKTNGCVLPIESGIQVRKYTNALDYFSFGFTISSRGSRYYSSIDNGGVVTKTWNKLSLLYLDIPMALYKSTPWFSIYNSKILIGLSPSILLRYPRYSFFETENNIYRSYNFSILSGIDISKNKVLNISILINQSIFSIIKPQHYTEVESSSEISPRQYPIEILLILHYNISSLLN